MDGTPEPDWSTMSDEELALLCSTHIAGCMDELIQRYESRVRECAHRMALDRDQAEDAVQEIFVRLVASLPRFEGRSAFATWLYRLAHNTCIDSFRKGTRDARRRITDTRDDDRGMDDLLENLPARSADPADELERGIQECYLGQALADLSPNYREIIRLRLGEGRSNEEVAAILGTTVDSVKAKLRRARKQLREHLLERRSCPVCRGLGALHITEAGRVD